MPPHCGILLESSASSELSSNSWITNRYEKYHVFKLVEGTGSLIAGFFRASDRLQLFYMDIQMWFLVCNILITFLIKKSFFPPLVTY